ncbi:PREDICTED: olfactory receptor 52K1-like [Nanorana parkeri]|uniref:olfactory receptor 52K1-like n=1 Tax=Nanorana parkeri TaxID=125878 RepID=UPI000854804A|nr:PREDICTED: olfactory receptor 52K1-like [Nanorana parkeri]
MPLVPNISFHMPSAFLLIGIPGLQEGSVWTSIFFCSLYVLAILGNGTILYIIKTEESLHTPMFFFLSMLALNDLAFSSSTVPKTLAIFWLDDGLIDATSCLTQMFFVHCLSVIESGTLASMAYDRFMAICSPLRYNSVLTYSLLEKIAFVILARAVVVIFPIPVLVGRLQYCGGNVVLHSYCDHMAVVNVACGDTQINSVYGLALSLFITGFDLLFIGLSYAMILRTIFKMPSREARHKAVGTCGSHICVIISAYLPGIFSFVTYRFGKKTVPHNVHIFLANIYIVFPAFMNPFIYGVRTKQIRRRVLHILTINPKAFHSFR